MLAPLTRSTSNKIEQKWTKIEQDIFYEIKRIVAHNTLSDYPDFNETFKTHNDASDFQLGLVIIQKGTHINFYGRKHTGSPKRYTVTEKELPRIV